MKVVHSYTVSTIDLTAEQMADAVFHLSEQLVSGELEVLRARQAKAEEIIGHLVACLPESKWIEVLGLQGTYRQAE